MDKHTMNPKDRLDEIELAITLANVYGAKDVTWLIARVKRIKYKNSSSNRLRVRYD